MAQGAQRWAALPAFRPSAVKPALRRESLVHGLAGLRQEAAATAAGCGRAGERAPQPLKAGRPLHVFEAEQKKGGR